MNEVQIFENNEFGELEILWENDKAYFPAIRCAEILGYSNTREAIRRHCKGGVKHALLTNGGKQEKKYISEGDLYRLIIRSKLEAAQRFETWVFDEVLPTIRKHGFYATDKTLDEMLGSEEQTKELLRKLKEEQALRRKNELSYEKLIAEKNELIEVLDEKAEYHDNVLNSERLMQMTLIAKDYGMSATRMNAMLYGYGVQYKVGKTWVLFAKYQNYGFTQTRTIRPRGCEEYIQVMYWTETG